MPPPRKATKKAKREKPVDPLPDPWVELTRGFLTDIPLRSGAVVEMLVYEPGTRMRRSHARQLGIDDFREVDGPKVKQPPGFQIVMTPQPPAGGFGTVERKWTT